METLKHRKSTKIERCLTLINLLQMRSPLTLQQICDNYQDVSPYGESLDVRQFYRYKDTIEQMMPCQIQKIDREYSLVWDEKITGDSMSGGLWGRIIAKSELATISHLIAEQSERIALLEPPSGEEQLRLVIIAMKKERGLTGTYTSRTGGEPKNRTWIPLFVVLWKSRWYMVAECTKHIGTPCVYALERFTNLHLTKTKFVSGSKYRTAEQYFKDQYGVYGPDYNGQKTPLKIRLLVKKKQLQYMTEPLFHSSLNIIEERGDAYVIELYLVPNKNFYQEILSLGVDVEVLSPAKVRDHIKDIVSKLHSKYW